MKASTRLTLGLVMLISLAGTTSATPIRQAQDLFRTASTYTLDFNTLPVGARVASLTLSKASLAPASRQRSWDSAARTSSTSAVSAATARATATTP